MAVLDPPRLYVDPPATFPIAHLSVSSINAYLRCPTSWKHRHIDKEPDRPNGKMIGGSAAGAALAQHFGRQIETGQGITTEELLDEYIAALDDRAEREDVDWGDDRPSEIRDSGAAALSHYHRFVAPDVHAVSIEREFELSWPGAPFVLTGYLDLEEADGAVGDFKLSEKRWSQSKAKSEIQPDVYLAARLAEGNPATEFRYHTIIRSRQPKAEILVAPRSRWRIEALTGKVFSIARSIEWRWLNDVWEGTAPDAAWMCGKCGHRYQCPWSLAGES